MSCAAKIIVHGLVQGVFFRARTVQEARKRKLSGFVRNLTNGNVEAWIQGDEVMVKQLIDWCRSGPSNARVDSVDVSWQEPDPQMQGFDVR